MPKTIKIIAGFVVLFCLYHTAEYFVLFTYSIIGFFSFQIAFFAAAILIAKWQGYNGLSAWGLDARRGWWKHLLTGMLMGILLYATAFIISLSLKSQELDVPPTAEMLKAATIFLVGNLFTSFSEDVLTRGYVYRHLNGKVSMGLLVFISASIYLLNHMYKLGNGPVTLGYLFALGLLFIIPLILTKRLWFTGGMHWLGNSTLYFTNSLSNEGTGHIDANLILLVCILLFIPLTVLVIRSFKLKAPAS